MFLIALQLAFGIWGPNPISDLLEGLIAYLPNIIVAVVILVIAAVLARVLTDMLTPDARRRPRWLDHRQGAGVAIMVVGVFAALDQLQVAPAIVGGLFYALLVMIVGSAVVAFGVGGIPIARRWLEQWSSGVERTARDVKEEVQAQAETEGQATLRRCRSRPTNPRPPSEPGGLQAAFTGQPGGQRCPRS